MQKTLHSFIIIQHLLIQNRQQGDLPYVIILHFDGIIDGKHTERNGGNKEHDGN